MWECPDFFPLDGKWVLIPVSIEIEKAAKKKYWNLNSTVAPLSVTSIGKRALCVDSYDEIDGGLDSMLLKLVKGPNGERYMVAGCKCGTVPSLVMIWLMGGRSMTLPRKLSLKDGRLVQELPESVKEHFLVKHFPETIVESDHDPS